MRKSRILTVFLISLFLISFASASYQLLCLEKGQTVKFSKCNANIPDRTCDSDTGCQYCVDKQGSVYCPANINACNGASFSCAQLAENSDDITPSQNTSNTNVTSSTLIVTNIDLVPEFPLENDGEEEDIDVDFTSNKYPLTATFKLYRSSGSLVETKSPISVSSSSDLPITYTLSSSLPDGDYKLELTLTKDSSNKKIINLGTITINSSPDDEEEKNTDDEDTESNNNNNNDNSESEEENEASDNSNPSVIGRIISSIKNTNDDKKNTEETKKEEDREEEKETNVSRSNINSTRITGAAINTVTNPKVSLTLIFIFLLMIFLLLLKKLKNKSQESKDPLKSFTV